MTTTTKKKNKKGGRESKYKFQERPCFKLFVKSIQSPDTRFVWANYVHVFMTQQKLTDYDQLLSEPGKMMQARLMEFIEYKDKVEGRRGQSIGNYITALWHFFWINEKEKEIAWDRVRAVLPEPIRAVEDVPYTHEQIRRLGSVARPRLRIAIYSEALGGPRIGGIAMLKKGDLTKNEYGFYRVIVYRGTRAAYVTYFGIEASKEIDEYFAYRERCGETLTDESPLIREEFEATDKFKVEHPRHISKRTLERQTGYAAVAAGLRTVEKGGGPHNRKKNMLTHGLRKFFKQQCRRAGVDPINLEYLVGHKNGDMSVGVTKLMMTYDPASEEELLQEYLKAMDYLTIHDEYKLRKELDHAKEELQTAAPKSLVAEMVITQKALLERIERLENDKLHGHRDSAKKEYV